MKKSKLNQAAKKARKIKTVKTGNYQEAIVSVNQIDPMIQEIMENFEGSEKNYDNLSALYNVKFRDSFKMIDTAKKTNEKWFKARHMLFLVFHEASEDITVEEMNTLTTQMEYARNQMDENKADMKERYKMIKADMETLGINDYRADKIIHLIENGYLAKFNKRFSLDGKLSEMEPIVRMGFGLPSDLLDGGMVGWILLLSEKTILIYGIEEDAEKVANMINGEFDDLDNNDIEHDYTPPYMTWESIEKDKGHIAATKYLEWSERLHV